MTHLISALVLLLMFVAGTAPCPAAGRDDAEKYYDRGIQALTRGESQQAVELISAALEINSAAQRYYNDRGVAFKRLGKLDEAIADYTRAIELQSDFASALNNRGVAYLEKGLYDKSIEDFSNALSSGELTSKIYTNRGMAYSLQGDQTKAMEDFKKAVSSRPLDYRSFLLIGDFLTRMGEQEKALKMYQLAAGLVQDKSTAESLETKITDLEKQVYASDSLDKRQGGSAPNGRGSVARKNSGSPPQVITSRNQQEKSKPGQNRPHIRQAEPPTSKTSLAPEPGTRDSAALYKLCREKALKTLPAQIIELYHRGEDHIRKSDIPKALLMYEDALQLAKRYRNEYAQAWTMLEMGRIHALMGDRPGHIAYGERALGTFERLKSQDEKALAALELAEAKRQPDANRQLARIRSEMLQAAQVPAEIRPTSPATRTQTAPAIVGSPGKKAAGRIEPIATPSAPKAPRQPPAPPNQSGGVQQAKIEPVVASPAEKAPKQPPGPTTHPGKAPPVRILPDLKQGTGRAIETAPGGNPSMSVPPAKKTEVREQPKRQSPSMTATVGADKSIQEYLSDLGNFKRLGDEASMIKILERLATKYMSLKKFDRAMHCLNVSMGFREKLGLKDHMDLVLLRAGTVKEHLGLQAAALEDFARGLGLSRTGSPADPAGSLSLKGDNLARTMGLEPKAVMAQLTALWKARMEGDEQTESQALHGVGKIYEKAGRQSDAAVYFARAAAALAAQRAQLLKKAGREREAEESNKQALGELKDLDYSRYLEMIKKLNAPGHLSRQH